MRCNNPELYYAAYEKAALTTFLNDNQNYQCISTFEQYVIKSAPSEVKKFIFETIFHQEKSHDSWDCSSEGIDFRLEERNRKYKMNLHTDDPPMSAW